MKKRLISLLLIVALMFLLFPTSALAGDDLYLPDGADYNLADATADLTIHVDPGNSARFYGTTPVTATDVTILCQSGTVTLDNATMLSGDIDFWSGNLILLGDSEIHASSTYQEAAIMIGGTYLLTISGTGSLEAYGSNLGAGIGGGGGSTVSCPAGKITINSGEITAYGGSSGGAGIGSAGNANGNIFTEITINGGMVTAIGGSGAAGIGAGSGGNGGTIDINGGTVYASMGTGGQHDIGDGAGGSGSALEISDTAAVFLENDSCVSPTTSHDHITFSVDTEEAYGLAVPAAWTPTFGAYLDLIALDYDANGGSGTVPNAVTQHIGTTTTVADGSVLSYADHVFSRWHTQADGGGISYTAGSDFTFNYDTTLYAFWGETTAENSNLTADVEETYNIIIPATVEFGTIEKDSGTVSQPFVVTASDVFIEPGDEIHVSFASSISWVTYGNLFLMHDAAENEWDLPYSLNNSGSQVGIGDDFASFTANGSESGHVDVDTSYIDYPGIYTDTMTFIISCP